MSSKIPITLFSKLESRLRRHLRTTLPASLPTDQLDLLQGDEVLAATIEALHITEDRSDQADPGDQSDSTDIDVVIENPDSSKKNIKIYLYKYPDNSDSSDESSQPPNKARSLNLDSDQDSSSSALYTLETFPSSPYTALWDSLQYDSTVKASILAYITAIFKFSLLGLTANNEISFNRILLLHGPPGTGKTRYSQCSL